jgi:gliding motility-associated-like protein
MTKKYFLLTVLILSIVTACKKSNLNKDLCDCAKSPTIQTIDTTILTIPNIFTPNGDGHNDYWFIKNINYFPNCHIKIMKEGLFHKTVYESTGYTSNFWNGEGKNDSYKYEITIGSTTITGYVCVVIGSKNFKLSDYNCIGDCTPMDNTDPLISL